MTATLLSPAHLAIPVRLHIGDRKLTHGSGGAHDHRYPADNSVTGSIPLAGAPETAEAIAAAHHAFDSWKRTKPIQRRSMLEKLAELIRQRSADFGALGTLDNGTPITMATGNAVVAHEWTNYYAAWADRIESRVNSTVRADGELGYTLAEPYGVIGIIITWNGPLISLAMKVVPAIAAGNTVVVKPSEMTPYASELFMQLVEEAGIPAGVVNMIPGSVEAGEALVNHPLVKKISFTGGPATARKILSSCAAHLKPAVLELGGKSANIIFPDADLDHAVSFGVIGSIGMMSGQGCAFPTRMLVHADIYDEVVERAVGLVQGLRVGDPLNPEILSGPVINQAGMERILEMVERAKANGAGRLIAGGNRLAGDGLDSGWFVEPTLFVDVDPDSELARKELFGPVLAITKFADEAEAIQIANNTNYSLSAYAFTRDLGRALRLAEELDSGVVLINGSRNIQPHRPFGGQGDSGYGREGGKEGIDEFLRIKTVGIGLPSHG